MRPAAGELLHFSQDPTIEHFLPHVAATSTNTAAPGVGRRRRPAPDYWFPRQCPRALAWVTSSTTTADQASIELRALENRWSFWDDVVGSSLGFSGIRLRNARPRPAEHT